MPTKAEKDALTGRMTTGHEWDGVTELNTPLPIWWLYVLYATVAVAVAMFVLLPAIPLGGSATKGTMNYSTRAAVADDLKALVALRAPSFDKIKAQPLADIRNDQSLYAVAIQAGKAAFGNNCAPCHGPAGSGHVGFPNLQDDVWLWGGSLEAIQQTITYGIRSGHPQARDSQMPRFGADAILKPEEIQQVADYVFSLYQGKPADAATAGGKLFAENCAVCHGETGGGNPDVGAPPLAAATHLYGRDRDAIVRQVTLPRQGVMPAWVSRLDEATIKSLTLYVHQLGGGQ